MTRIILLEKMRDFTEKAVKGLLLPIPPPDVLEVKEVELFDEDSGSALRKPPPPPPRPVRVFLTALPEKSSAVMAAPYILHQAVKSRDLYPAGGPPRSEIVLRSVFCVYHDDGEAGGLALLGLMERLRIALLRQRVLGRQFSLDLAAGVETLVYSNTEPPPYGTAPFYLGEMITTWKCPTVFPELPRECAGGGKNAITKGESSYGKEGNDEQPDR